MSVCVYLSVCVCVSVCLCLNTLMISVLSDWLADGVDLSDSAVCQAVSASALENMSEGADN